MSEQTEQNARIESASLECEDHGILSSFIMLEFDGSGQGFGGYALYLPKECKHHKLQSVAGHWIWRIMEIAGVKRWDDLRGKTIRVRHDKPYGNIIAIGHIIKDDWFNPREEFEETK